jgi:hypothetical protein
LQNSGAENTSRFCGMIWVSNPILPQKAAGMSIVPPTRCTGTRDLPDVPPFVQAILGQFLVPILAWLSTLVYRPILARCATHPLVLLAHHYDLASVVDACASYQHRAGPGAPPTYTVALFVRAELVRAWADTCSDRELEWLLASNLLVRWFVGLPLCGPTPDHATLSRFHAWLTLHAPDALFADVLTFLNRVDPEDPTTTQIVDTFAMASPVAPSRTVAHLLAHLARRLGRVWQSSTPPALHGILDPADLTTVATLPFTRTLAERQARLQAVVEATQRLAAALTPHLNSQAAPLRQAIQSYQCAIAKVIADELTCDDHRQWHERPAAQRGEHRLASAVDREATFRKHDGSPAVLGTNAVISTTTTRIRACVALSGSQPDSLAPGTVLTQQRAADRPFPAYLVMDQAGGWGKTRASVDAISQGQTQMVARVPTSGGSDPSRFSVADFQIDADLTRCTCPNGQTSTRVYRHGTGDGDGVSFRFLVSQCRGCPFWEHCRDPEAKPDGHRSVYISDHHRYLRAGAAFNQSAAGQALLRQRWQVEPTIAWLVRYQGCRAARRVGQAAAQCQLYQACAVRNLLVWLERSARRRAT